MATAAASSEFGSGYAPSPPLSVARSPDTASSIYPERAIRPLPRSRLKSKLSPQQVTSIVYPPEPSPLSPTLHFSSAQVEVDGTPTARLVNGNSYPYHHEHDEEDLPKPCTCGGDHGESADEVEFDHPHYRYSSATLPMVNGSYKPLDSVQRRLMEASRLDPKPPPPGSTASSADGYESFENTSNKKKRKIPLSSASSMHQSQLSAEMANMGISHPEGGHQDDTIPEQYTQGAAATVAGTGISGAGRGRYGRQNGKHERRPLASSSLNTVNGYHAHPAARMSDSPKDGSDAGIENTGGIISQAIKSAAKQAPLTPHRGRDQNVSLLQSAASSSTATPKTQFTFSCESESATKMVDQQVAAAAYASPSPTGPPMPYHDANGHPVPGSRGINTTQGTQTTPSLRQAPPGTNTRLPPPSANHAPGQLAGQLPGPGPAPRPKPRRRPSKEYALASRQRQLQQEYTNYHHRPAKDNMYICEFCEYEDIFGVKPVAMIRHYEIKDRQERKKAAEKRRLLEKAKMKNRKGKKGKGGKNSHANNNAAATPPPPQGHGAHSGQHYDPNLPPGGPDGDEYFEDDEYGDEYEPADEDLYPDGLNDAGYYPPPVSHRSGIQAPASTPAPMAPGIGSRGGVPSA